VRVVVLFLLAVRLWNILEYCLLAAACSWCVLMKGIFGQLAS